MPSRAKKEKRPVAKIDFKSYGAAIKAGRKKQNESRNKAGSDMFLSPHYKAKLKATISCKQKTIFMYGRTESFF